MNIRLTYHNASGKKIEKDFSDPMEIIGYIYRCWASARNAASTRAIRARLDAEGVEEVDAVEAKQKLSLHGAN